MISWIHSDLICPLVPAPAKKKPHKRTSIEKNWWKELPEASNCRNSHRYYRQYQPRHRLQKSHWIRLEWKWWVCLPWEMRKLRIEARTKREGRKYFILLLCSGPKCLAQGAFLWSKMPHWIRLEWKWWVHHFFIPIRCHFFLKFYPAFMDGPNRF